MRWTCAVVLGLVGAASAHPDHHPWRPKQVLDRADVFERLDDRDLPSPNRYRGGSGAPGPDYWQQQVDYDIDVTLDTQTHRLVGTERITYHNNSPDTLHWLWVQLDQNRFRPDARGRQSRRAPDLEGGMSFDDLRYHLGRAKFEGGADVGRVQSSDGMDLPHVIDGTMMRIDLPTPLKPGRRFQFDIDWTSAIVPDHIAGRSGYETFDDGRTLYQIAQWFPRLAAYTDYDGWQTRPFLGRGEFTLEFGDYDVNITAPANFLVGATGELVNPRSVLSSEQRSRLEEARASDHPRSIVSRAESDALVAAPTTDTKTWRFTADNIRDFAFSASPAFAWDAMGVDIPGRDDRVLAMSMWPAEGDGLWDLYSTHAVAHALESYSQTAMPYPWPVAWSVNGVVGGGMEYPMMTFNGPRPEEDGTWTERSKYGLISVVIHEVGHFWFPMIVNSDERQWTWMDEGINTYHQFLAERSWEEDYARSRGLPRAITGYMRDVENSRPIMTASESILQFGANAYAKPATALNILRETVVGRELFDHAMRAYTRRWAYKRPEPADFFRSIEDASGRDLDWFWRGWFYDTRPVDVGIAGVETFRVASGKPEGEKAADREDEARNEPTTVTAQRNAGTGRRVERYPELIDFYSTFDKHAVTPADQRAYEKLLGELDQDDLALLETDELFHVLRFTTNGGLVMPLPIRVTWADGSTESLTIPADIWRADQREATKLLISPHAIDHVMLDPYDELADVDRSDNRYPPEINSSRFGLSSDGRRTNPMQQAAREEARAATQLAVEQWAEAATAGWRDAGDDRRAQVAAVHASPLPDDGWGQPTRLSLGGAGDDGLTVRIVSDGPDGIPGTPDDLSADVQRDGQVAPLRTASERPVSD
ncbi:MAG: M1 family metallopeptidase [Phycisphaerales bacterium]|nr:M1 family metallopeptidase [Phycisphaerales bacterium]